MNQIKVVIFVETILISFLTVFLMIHLFSPDNAYVTGKVSYCDKYLYNTGICLLSPRIYTGILQPNNYLMLNFESLKQHFQKYITDNNLNISLYVLNLGDSASFGINSNEEFEPASLNKLPIAILILKKIENGKLTLDTELEIKDYHRDSKSGTLYNSEINRMSVNDLLYYMLSKSDNTAFRVLEEQVTLDDLESLSLYLGYYTKHINNIPFDNIYKITPKSTANLFLSLYLSTDLQPEHSDLILSLLMNTSFDINKYANLSDVPISQKYGSYYAGNESFFHDCGIMYIQESRIFYCIMTRELDEEKASKSIGAIVHDIYSYVLPEPG
jgi:beta-lactamase class A